MCSFLSLPILSIAIDCISPVDQGEGDSKHWDNFYLCKVITFNTVLRRKKKYLGLTNKCGHIENTSRLTSLGIFLRILNLSGESVVVNCVLLIEQLNNCKENHLLSHETLHGQMKNA